MSTVTDKVKSLLLAAQPKAGGVWQCVGDDSEYSDYEHFVPDVNGYGARLRITLAHSSRTCWVSVVIDDQDGERYIENSVPGELPWEVAIAMTQHESN